MTISKSMSMVRGCDAPSLTPGSILGPRTGDRIPGMLKIKGPELKRA